MTEADPTASSSALFVREGDTLLPTPIAASTWGPDVVHGGPVAILVARAAERALPSDDPTEGQLLPSRLTIDLFRSVPRVPLTTEVELIRQGRRVVVARVSVLADTLEVSRGQVLFLRRTSGPATVQAPAPPNPADLETVRGLSRGAPLPDGRQGGYHTLVETRWPTESHLAGTPFEGQPRGSLVWVRLPIPILEDEPPTPFQRLAAVSDFGNALANYAADWHDPGVGRPSSFINADISVSMLRPPQGEWLAVVADRSTHTDGVGLVEVTHHDHLGPYARGNQVRLANQP